MNRDFNIFKESRGTLTSFYHRIKARKGSLGAIKATARKIAVIFYNVMTKGIEFVEQGLNQYEQKIKFINIWFRTAIKIFSNL